MTREEALKIATDHVNTMSTNGRGYQDGVRFPDKVDSVERLARFLMEGEAPEGVSVEAGGIVIRLTADRRALLNRVLRFQVRSGPSDDDAAAEELLRELEA